MTLSITAFSGFSNASFIHFSSPLYVRMSVCLFVCLFRLVICVSV